MSKKLYFIAIALPSPQKEEIIALKESFVDRYGVSHALKSPPHITLHMPMRIETDREAELVEQLKNTCSSIDKGLYRLKGLSSFPPRTIFIDVEKNTWLENARITVQKAMKKAGFGRLDKQFHPHVTLMTRDLDKETYQRAFPQLQVLSFDDVLHAERITLFKHDGNQWQALKQFKLD